VGRPCCGGGGSRGQGYHHPAVPQTVTPPSRRQPKPTGTGTPRDDVADHEKWAKHFGARRIIHAGEATARQGTDQCEVIINGQGPWAFPDGDGDLTIVHTPGHTEDHCVLISDKHKVGLFLVGRLVG
jgi:glyoxylase-like metal-dependent hydrolase (beta-lactamase superfamily II)